MTTTKKMNSLKKWTATAVATTVFAIIGALATLTVFAETNIGHFSQDQIRTACNAAGGELLGVSDYGSYGCEVESKGTLILCHKDQSCTSFAPAQTKPNRQTASQILTQGAKTVAK